MDLAFEKRVMEDELLATVMNGIEEFVEEANFDKPL